MNVTLRSTAAKKGNDKSMKQATKRADNVGDDDITVKTTNSKLVSKQRLVKKTSGRQHPEVVGLPLPPGAQASSSSSSSSSFQANPNPNTNIAHLPSSSSSHPTKGDFVKTIRTTEECIICARAKPDLITLCCGAAAHFSCYRKWVIRKPTCPVCREGVEFTRDNEGGNAAQGLTVNNFTVGIQI